MNPYPSAYSPYSTDPLHKSVVDIALPTSFRRKKSKILADLSVSTSEYDDLSPKGSVDDSIRDLIDEINGQHGFVTTSSCGGRISVFLEGIKKDNIGKRVERRDEDEESENENGSRDRQATLAAVGGKGGGGRWLFVSHDPICIDGQAEGDLRRIFGMDDPENKEKVFGEGTNREQLVHFKFEPMILHILTASLAHAQAVLTAAFSAGFRESGALNLYHSTIESETTPTPVVAVRTMGLGFESIIGYHELKADRVVSLVGESVLRGFVRIANERFVENTKRVERFRAFLKQNVLNIHGIANIRRKADGTEWEDPDVRRARKKAEGLQRAQTLRNAMAVPGSEPVSGSNYEGLELTLGV